MTTANDWIVLQRLEQNAQRVGMKLTISRYGNGMLALIPLDDSLPIYSRDLELACGTADHLQSVLQGWDAAIVYYTQLKVLLDSNINLEEDQVRQDRTLYKLSTGKKQM